LFSDIAFRFLSIKIYWNFQLFAQLGQVNLFYCLAVTLESYQLNHARIGNERKCLWLSKACAIVGLVNYRKFFAIYFEQEDTTEVQQSTENLVKLENEMKFTNESKLFVLTKKPVDKAFDNHYQFFPLVFLSFY